MLLGCVASRPVIGCRLCRSNSTHWVWRWPRVAAVVLQMHAGNNCRHCYRLRYPQPSGQCIDSVKPARSESTWRLVDPKTGDINKAMATLPKIKPGSLPRVSAALPVADSRRLDWMNQHLRSSRVQGTSLVFTHDQIQK